MPEAENYSLFGRQDGGLKPETHPRELWGIAQKEQGGELGDTGFLQQRPGGQSIKRLLLIKEDQIFQVKEHSTSLFMGRCESGLPEIIPLICISAFSRASLLCILNLSLLYRGWGGCSVWLLDGRHPISIPSSLAREAHDCNILCSLIQQATAFIHSGNPPIGMTIAERVLEVCAGGVMASPCDEVSSTKQGSDVRLPLPCCALHQR